MCLIAFAIGASQRWPLVIASNRDEFLDRPTLPLARWHTPTGMEIYSGRDLRAGGSWLGVTPAGRLAMLTNVRDAQSRTGDKSRGELVTHWLESGLGVDAFIAQIDAAAFGGFNLVLGDFQAGNWHWLSNKPGPGLTSRPLTPGIYGLSNAALDTPWPKTAALKQALAAALEAPDLRSLQAGLWSALQDRRRAGKDLLPSTGVPHAVEVALSSAFVDFPEHGYGTRCSTLLVASATSATPAAQWDLRMQETTHIAGVAEAGLEQSCRIVWQSPVL